MSKFIKGMDLSTLLELERCGAKYYEDGKEKDILDIMKEHDVDTIRLRPVSYTHLDVYKRQNYTCISIICLKSASAAREMEICIWMRIFTSIMTAISHLYSPL